MKKLETKNLKLSDAQKLSLLKDIEKLRPGQVAMMENVRFSKDEEKDTGTLSQELAALADLFVLEGFAVAHRASASVSGIPKYIKGYAGLLLTKEIQGLMKVLSSPKTPFPLRIIKNRNKTQEFFIPNLFSGNYQLLFEVYHT